MKPEMAALIHYRLDRAHESIEEARLLLEHGHLHSSVNRLYYACFYAVSGLLLTEGLSSAKHIGEVEIFVAAISDVIRKWEENDKAKES